jgi:hypothetical protein
LSLDWLDQFIDERCRHSFSRNTFQFYGYQRSDGGVYSIRFDNGPDFEEINVYNVSSTGNDHPVLLYTKLGLSNAIHTVTITNLYDARTSKYGQMNVSEL